MSRLSTSVLVLTGSLLMAACSGDSTNGDAGVTAASVPESTATTEATTTLTTSTESSVETGATEPGGPACRVIERAETGEVERVELVETSGLAASRRHDGLLWAVNDSGQRAGLYAFDQQGRDLGFFALVRQGAAVSTADVEDLAIVDGTLYLADIGDNGAQRDTVAVYVVDEPDPVGDGEVEVTAVIEFRYPDGPTDAEAMVADAVGGQLVILSKDLEDGQAPTRIYTVPLTPSPPTPGEDGQVVEATLVGEIDVAALTASSNGFSLSTLLFPGSVTGADVVPGDDLIAIRTYGSVWLYRRDLGASVAEALVSAAPCEVGSATEQQGEAVAFLPPLDGDDTNAGGRLIRYVTVSEGGNPPVNLSLAEFSG